PHLRTPAAEPCAMCRARIPARRGPATRAVARQEGRANRRGPTASCGTVRRSRQRRSQVAARARRRAARRLDGPAPHLVELTLGGGLLREQRRLDPVEQTFEP